MVEGARAALTSRVMALSLTAQMANLRVSAKAPVRTMLSSIQYRVDRALAHAAHDCQLSGRAHLHVVPTLLWTWLQTLKRFEGFKAAAAFKNAPTAKAVQVCNT